MLYFYSDRVRSHMLTRRHVLTVAIYISLTLSLPFSQSLGFPVATLRSHVAMLLCTAVAFARNHAHSEQKPTPCSRIAISLGLLTRRHVLTAASEAFRDACAFLREYVSLRKLLSACSVKRNCSPLTTSGPACYVSGSGRFPSTSVWVVEYTYSESSSNCPRYLDQ